MSFTLNARGGPPDSVLPLSRPGHPSGSIATQQVSRPHEFLRYQTAILKGTVSQGTDLSHRATAHGLARLVDELEGKVKGIQKEIVVKQEEIQNLDEGLKEKKGELEPFEHMIEKMKA